MRVPDLFSLSIKYKLAFTASIIGESELFQFLLCDKIDNDKIKILIPDWSYAKTKVRELDTINFHLALQIDELFVTKGHIDNIIYDSEQKGFLCTIAIITRIKNLFDPSITFSPLGWQVRISSQKSPETIILEAIKSCYIIKRGLAIYVNHLFAYFSRMIGHDNPDYQKLKFYILNEIRDKIVENKKKLKYLYLQLKNKKGYTEMLSIADPYRLLELLRPEINVELFNLMFGSSLHLPPIEAINQLEDFIYWDYNTIVLLLLKSIQERQSSKHSGTYS